RLPGRSRRIASLNRAIDEWLVGIVQQRLVLGPALFSRDALREEIRIEGRGRSQGKNLAVVRIHRNDHAATLRRFAQLVLSGLLQIKIDSSHDVLTRLRLDPLNFVLNMATTIDDYFPVTIPTAQVFVIDSL